jgi:hypothetical protein
LPVKLRFKAVPKGDRKEGNWKEARKGRRESSMMITRKPGGGIQVSYRANPGAEGREPRAEEGLKSFFRLRARTFARAGSIGEQEKCPSYYRFFLGYIKIFVCL